MSVTSSWSALRHLVVCLGLLAASAASAAAQVGTVTVRVVSEGAPVEAAQVSSGDVGALTDERGEAVLRLPAGEHVLDVTKFGYATTEVEVTVAPGGDAVIVVTLEVEAIETDGIVVTSTRAERRIEDERYVKSPRRKERRGRSRGEVLGSRRSSAHGDRHHTEISGNEEQLLAVAPPVRLRTPASRHQPLAACGHRERLHLHLVPPGGVGRVRHKAAVGGELGLRHAEASLFEVQRRRSVVSPERQHPECGPPARTENAK
jgi:hypothetical protein